MPHKLARTPTGNWSPSRLGWPPAARTWNRGSIRLKFGFALGVVASLSVFLVTVVQTVYEHQNLNARALRESRLAAGLAAAQVEEVITKTIHELAVIAADPILVEQLQADDIPAMDRRLEAMGPADPNLTAIVVIDTRPRVRAISLTEKSLLDRDYSDQLHVQIVLGQGTPGIGNPRRGLITGLPIVPIGVPIRASDGQLIGVLQGSLSLQKLTMQLGSIELGQSGAVTLFSADGTILAHPEKSRILTPASGENASVAEALAGTELASSTRNEAGSPVFAAAVPVQDSGWVTNAEIPVDEALAPLRDRLQRAVVVGLLVLLAAMFLGSVLARVLTAPIALLQSATRRMANEEYVPGSLAVRSGDELEQLANDFEQMVLKVNESEQRYRTISELTSDFAYAFDVTPDRQLLPAWQTDALARITGYSIGELAAKGGWYGIVHPSDRDVAERRREVLYSGHTDVSEFRIVTKKGDERVLRVHVRPVWDSELGRVTRIFGAAQDITEKQHLEGQLQRKNQELEEQNRQLQEYQRREDAARALELRRKQQHARVEALRALGQMAGGIAHDLNQSLGLISGYSDIAQHALERTPLDVAALRSALPLIRTAALDGGETVKRLLAWTRLRPDDDSQIFDLGSLLRDVADLTAPRWRDATQLEGRPISLFVEVDGDTTVTGRQSAIREALTNLVFNAVDAMPEGGTIRLSARRVGSSVETLVTDSGVGMPPEVVARIFDPFFTTKGDLGTGLGLAQVRSIVEDHGGTLVVKSMPGQGAVIGMRLPGPQLDPQKTCVETPSDPAGPLEAALRVLAVDDEPAMTTMVRTILQGAGHTVVTAQSAEEALEVLRAESFDLVVSDMGLGAGMNGWQLAEHVRRSFPTTRFMLATGWGAQIDPAEAAGKGVDAVVSKPYSMDTMYSAVREAMSVADRVN